MTKRLRLPAFLVCVLVGMVVTGRTGEAWRLVAPQTIDAEVPSKYQEILEKYLDKFENEYRQSPEAVPVVQSYAPKVGKVIHQQFPP